MDAFIKPMHEIEEFLQIDKKLKTNAGVIQVTGCIDSQKSHMVYSLGNGFDKKAQKSEKRSDFYYRMFR